ncbi:hypothetical protein [Paraliomyxa miuraensis]|uniref:hypothetical protein n=1 Tax=Paraliomyxa miuraensis TaxID=376150 RepID=UPI00225461C7|nr:hypothetical protein [Paraliomyxa miuraensis]MCX4239872.1 hypothetical protein [Paraliomyxa miuraensis]
MKSPHQSPPLDGFLTATTLADAFRSAEHEIRAIPKEQLARISVDIPKVTQNVFGAAERLDELLPSLEQLSFYDPGPARRLRTHAAAALHAHLVATNLGPTRDRRLPTLLEEGRELRSNLMVGAESLAHFGLLPADQVAALRTGTRPHNLPSTLSTLSMMLGAVWTEVENKVPITPAMVARAAELGLELQVALGVRRLPRDTLASREAKLVRAQAFTLLVRTHDTCRRGVTFLRWGHGDVDWYLPSLYVQRSSRRSRPSFDETPAAASAEDSANHSSASRAA